jgi:hypothetical protein
MLESSQQVVRYRSRRKPALRPRYQSAPSAVFRYSPRIRSATR